MASITTADSQIDAAADSALSALTIPTQSESALADEKGSEADSKQRSNSVNEMRSLFNNTADASTEADAEANLVSVLLCRPGGWAWLRQT